jgi:prepilin-type N-terminal cleavage/methylation domain-containing protein
MLKIFNKTDIKTKTKAKKGFTIIELLVSITIMAFVASISISAYPKFAEQMGVTGELYKLLAFARETQTYGISSYGAPGTKFVYGFVIEKDTSSIKRIKKESPENFNNSYFRDSMQELLGEDVLNLKSLYKVENICLEDNCDISTSINKAYIIYKRPNPEARIFTLEGTNISPGQNRESHNKIVVKISSIKNKNISKKLVILKTGQAYVSDW